MNPFEMTVLIVAIVCIARVAKAKYAYRDRAEDTDDVAPARADVAMMADELRRLRDRVAVLERIATDGDGAAKLDREIEALRMDRTEARR